MLESMGRKTDLVMTHAEDYGFHYARTLRDWHDRFNASTSQLESLGYDQSFRRLWQFYFAYCEAGFSERAIGVNQVLMAKPQNKRAHLIADSAGA